MWVTPAARFLESSITRLLGYVLKKGAEFQLQNMAVMLSISSHWVRQYSVNEKKKEKEKENAGLNIVELKLLL